APSDTWYLAEGSTGGTPGERLNSGNFETWILVQNPGDDPALIDIFYQTPGGAVAGPQDVILEPQSRQSFDVSEGVPDEWSVSTQVIASEPVIAERSMYWNIPYARYADGAVMYAPRWCAHDSIGVVAPDFNWEVANCRTDTAFDSWILVQNPWDDVTAVISIDYTTPDGLVPGPQNVEIPPNSRESFQVSETVQGIQNVGATVRNTGGEEVTVVVEHSTYWGPSQGEEPQSYRVAAGDTICFPWENLI
ncbi:MAG: hypothetical protein JXA49_00200, partial [Actinobacteria bacterium]|nr:hypothetical protein [Actinomycetota bacterium]